LNREREIKIVTQFFPEVCSRNFAPIGANTNPVNGYFPGIKKQAYGLYYGLSDL
jgi:hypothetical protein